MDRDLLYHVQDIDHANPIALNRATLSVRARRADVSSCALILGGHEAPIPMERLESSDRYDLYQVAVTVPPEGISYSFKVVTDGRTKSFTKYGVYETDAHFGSWSLMISAEDVFSTPDWVKDAVFYQIFPERFCNGDPSNDPPGSVPWDAKPELENFFGGDLQGVLDRLDYLSDLGVNALYFNPLFEATTNHKYNTTDYMKVEPSFGDNALLKKLVAEAHRRGMRVVLDAVFNHVGVKFAPFQDVIEKGLDSPYLDWFFIKSFPIVLEPPNYACWWNLWELPKLNTNNPEVRRYLLEVAEYWIRECDIDGWRLDVPEEVPQGFWREFRGVVKAAKPDAYIVGEIWHDGRPWLRGDQFDAVMNYPLREAILSLLGGVTRDGNTAAPVRRSVVAYHKALHELLTDLPVQVLQAQFNLLGSHDTERLMTLLDGDERKVRLAMLLLMTAPGAPVVYYGDEIGMEGGKDPDCRRGFPWDGPWNESLREWVQKLIRLRHQHPALRTGEYRSLRVDGEANVYAFERRLDGERIVGIVNPNDAVRTGTMDVGARTALTLAGGASVLQSGKLSFDVPPLGSVLVSVSD
ncbi:MAG: DUF3459 domain-containing protein [Armatimonadetes bacterium]|nr:DUF3459 domain-containing protein [Armatimonadota bacterium]